MEVVVLGDYCLDVSKWSEGDKAKLKDEIAARNELFEAVRIRDEMRRHHAQSASERES